ncbi:MAG: tRNA (adenosine(37)-N6)-threonylcarbamoyltransferase complex dimerization subunit type 1 TsaB [Chitinophagaceae bacterium]|nr:tRNA (adenosine(37)-N6)-threonylcarbamoyltransferase complex dimerization subunit type 1 TsaB [Chitinophagaceae bacterium]
MNKQPFILAIDTAQESASVCIAKDKHLVAIRTNNNQKDHAVWIHNALEEIRIEAGIAWNELDAVAISNGPGSYTGLRVGLSTAKGLCYTLDKPLITIGTLEMMAWGMKELATDLICPLIDARRMEVYYAVYDKALLPIEEPSAKILQQKSFDNYIYDRQIVFAGSGSFKLKELMHGHENATFINLMFDSSLLILPSLDKYLKGQFADLAYVEPLYVKEFYSTSKRPLI